MSAIVAPSPSTFQQALSWRYSTLAVWTAIALLFVETLSGALRYHLDMAGASALIYVPKLACLALFALHLVSAKLPRLLWVALLSLCGPGAAAWRQPQQRPLLAIRLQSAAV